MGGFEVLSIAMIGCRYVYGICMSRDFLPAGRLGAEGMIDSGVAVLNRNKPQGFQ